MSVSNRLLASNHSPALSCPQHHLTVPPLVLLPQCKHLFGVTTTKFKLAYVFRTLAEIITSNFPRPPRPAHRGNPRLTLTPFTTD